MCGIMGYIGSEQAAPILLNGLKTLEYRGYDSAGMAVMHAGRIHLEKASGRLSVLAERTDGGCAMRGQLGLGHTRWATHGEPSDTNSHPHMSQNLRFSVVHNGIIENYQALKTHLEHRGYIFRSETDTEVVAHLVEYCDCGNLVETVIRVMQRIEGSYALGVMSVDEPDRFVAVRKDSPLIAAAGASAGFIASDIPALLPHTRDMYLMADHEIVEVRADGLSFYDACGEPLQKDVFHVDWDVAAAEKGGYEHFMMKEIMDQPKAILDTVSARLSDGRFCFEGIDYSGEWIRNLRGIDIVACGSAYHAGLVGRYMLEDILRIPVTVDIASEFRYRNPLVDERHLVIVISQSGETADSLAALREARRLGARTLAIVNVVGSSIARDADDVIYTWAGPEISVATTKGYTTQLMVLSLLAGYLGQQAGCLSETRRAELVAAMTALPGQIESLLQHIPEAQQLASQYFNCKDVFFIGRGIDYALSQEASLKLKEISYIHSEGIAAGELKHGTISLIEPGSLVIGLATQPKLREKVISNLAEVRTRGATVLALALTGDDQLLEQTDRVMFVPPIEPMLAPILSIIPLQLFAYYVSVYNGCDVDKPRNLAKSVTVE